MKRVAFCNNNGGGGKSTLVFHLGHMLADFGRRALLVDLDPQSTLTAMCVSEERLEELWPDAAEHSLTVAGAVASAEVHVEPLRDGLGLVAGDLGLSSSEAALAEAWLRAAEGDEPARRTLMALPRVIESAARQHAAELVLVNVGPNLGAINRTALSAADLVVVPLAPDPFAVQGLRALGPTLATWRGTAASWVARDPDADLSHLFGPVEPVGYVVMQAAMRLQRPARAYERWLARVPVEYHRSVLEDPLVPPPIEQDPWYLGTMRHHHGLALLARDVGKPMFHLRAADGAMGSYMAAVQRCREDFEALARTLLDRAGLCA